MKAMEEDQELRFVCKLCNKKYPSGKSLGGHMRSHVIADEKTDHILPNNKLSIRLELGGGNNNNNNNNNNNSGYVLRENPKKSWRAKDSPIANNNNINFGNQQQQEKLMVCRQCGKGFHSLKALCGHMACHSDRERGSKLDEDDSSWNTDNRQKLVTTDSHSDTESDGLSRRSSGQMMMRYNNCSSNSSEIDHEQEELALCLMMLSRESGKWVNMNSHHVLLDSSISHDHNNNSDSVNVSETKSFSNKSNSDSGYFMTEPDQKILESDIVVTSKKKRSVPFLIDELQISSKKKRLAAASLSSTVNVDGSKNVFKRSKHKTTSCFDYYKNKYNNSDQDQDQERPVKSKKVKGHVCPICNRVFKSGQALGGHKRSHFLVGSSQERSHHHGRTSVLMKQEESEETHDFLDLNLPPPTEE